MCIRKKMSTMDNIKSNYKKVSKIQEEQKNVNIENHLEFNYQGDYVFRKCEYCDGPLQYTPREEN